MTTRHRVTTRRSSVVAGALVLLLTIAITACGSDTKAGDTDAVERSAATYRGTRACFTNNTSESIGIAAGDGGFSSDYFGNKQPESLDPISLGGTSWCRQVDGGYLDGGSLGFEVWLRRSQKVSVLLKNTFLNTGVAFGNVKGSCTIPPPMENFEPGSSTEGVCDGVKITVTFKRTSTYFQEWDINFSQN